MAGASMSRNGGKARFKANTTRPSGAAALATSRDRDGLLLALSTGNRQTRRLAAQNLQKMLRKAGTVSAGQP